MSDTSLDSIRTHMAVFQDSLPLVAEPFAAYAEHLGISQKETIELLHHYLAAGTIRRVAGVLKHRRAGFVVNAMAAFVVKPEACDRAGAVLARFPFITHCYRRTAYPDWSYTIYAMVHARSREEFDGHIEKIRSAVACEDMIVLRSIKEFKKTAFRMGERGGRKKETVSRGDVE